MECYTYLMLFGVDVKVVLAVLSVVIAILWGFVPYFRDIFRRKTQPHAYTWLIWSIT